MAIYSKKHALAWKFWLVPSTALLIALLLSTKTWATTFYVSDTTLEAILRSGPDPEYRIIASLPVGTRVSLIREENGWAEVSLADGRTGWTLRRYLSDRPPWHITAESLAKEKEQLEAQISDIASSNRALREENESFKKQVDALGQELETIRKDYDALKMGAANYSGLQKAYEKLKSDLPQVKAKLAEVQSAHNELQSSTSLRWFLAGAGAIVIGWILGRVLGGRRLRRSKEIYR